MRRSKIRFAHKITILITSFILLTAIGITAVTAYQFRRELYQQEYSGAFTVYMAAVNYLTGHYKSHHDTFIHRSLTFVFDQKFLRLEGAESDLITHRPAYLVIYDPAGNLVYEYGTSLSHPAPTNVPVATLPTTYRHVYDQEHKTIEVGGPISPEGDVPGFVSIQFTTDIERKTAELFLNSFIVMMIALLIAIGLSLLFARRVLAPIEALTRAAKRVHAGDLEQQVPATTSDEIGMLTATFNEIVSSLVHRIALMHRMQEWTVRISKEFDINLLYENLMDMFERMSGATWCRLFVFNARNNALERVRQRGGQPEESSTADVLTTRAYEDGITAFLRADGSTVSETTEAMEMAFPLIAGKKRIGVVRMGPPHVQGGYTDDTLTTLQTMVQHASVAIDNANLYQELAAKERFKQEMMWAREIQQSLLPRTVPHVAGYDVAGVSIPAFEVGGDYFDYVKAQGNQWHFIIGDVSGKGVPAALIMSIVRSLIHTYIEFEQRPRDILSKVNRNLSPDLEAEMFVTVSTIRLDPETHRAQLVRAGHEPFIVVRANGDMERMEPRGTALGLLDVATFDKTMQEVELQFEPHDTVLLYTDGITETRNRLGEEFGYSRLEHLARTNATLPVQELLKVIVSAVSAFAEGQEQQDDITLMILRRNSA